MTSCKLLLAHYPFRMVVHTSPKVGRSSTHEYCSNVLVPAREESENKVKQLKDV